MLRKLDEFGLGIILPHMHDQDGYMISLPEGIVGFEDMLQVEFRSTDDPDVQSGAAVGWRWDQDKNQTSIVTYARLSKD